MKIAEVRTRPHCRPERNPAPLLGQKAGCIENLASLLLALRPAATAKRKGRADWDDYLRDQAANYRKLAETADDPVVKQEHFELAAVC